MALGSLYVQQYFTDHSKRAVSLLWKLFQNFSFMVKTFSKLLICCYLQQSSDEGNDFSPEAILSSFTGSKWMDGSWYQTYSSNQGQKRMHLQTPTCIKWFRFIFWEFLFFLSGTTYEREDRISRLHLESNGTFARIPCPGTVSVFLTFSLSVLFLSLSNLEMFGFKLEMNQ